MCTSSSSGCASDFRPICEVVGKYRDSLRKPTHEILYRTSRVCVCSQCCFSNLVSWLRLVTDSKSEENIKTKQSPLATPRTGLQSGSRRLDGYFWERPLASVAILIILSPDSGTIGPEACVSFPSPAHESFFLSKNVYIRASEVVGGCFLISRS